MQTPIPPRRPITWRAPPPKRQRIRHTHNRYIVRVSKRSGKPLYARKLKIPTKFSSGISDSSTRIAKGDDLGRLRIALECEKKPENGKIGLLEEPMWTMYVDGKKTGYGMKREANEEDLNVIELLRPESMGASVLLGNADLEGPGNELAHIRAHFEQVVGLKDSETPYMLSPEGKNGPELTIFFVRIG